MKKILEFLSENFLFFVVKFSVYLNRRVCVMGNHEHIKKKNKKKTKKKTKIGVSV